MQSLLKGLPIAAQSYNYAQPSQLSNLIGAGGIIDLLRLLTGGGDTSGGSSGGSDGGDSGTSASGTSGGGA